MKKRPHDFLWRGSQMESKLMPGKEVTQQRTHNSKTFDLGRGAYHTVSLLKPILMCYNISGDENEEIRDNH